MNIFDDYTQQLLLALNSNNVQYLIVGGYAVNYHGYRRTTGDIDLWIKPDNVNKEKVISSLKSLLVNTDALIELTKLDFTKPLVFIDGEEPFKIDFMTYVSGVEFEAAWSRKIDENFDGIKVQFMHFDHLIISKFTTGRAKDKLDIEELQKIKKMKKE